MEKIDARHYDVSPGDCLFFDTNVWLIVNGPMASSYQQAQNVYGRLLKDAISRGACVWICSSVVSEYINVVLRIGYKNWLESNRFAPGEKDFKKDYRPTDDYRAQLEDAKQQVNEILGYGCIKRMPDSFHTAPISQLMAKMANDCDYNDAYYIYLCKQSGIKLVSNDADFKAQTDSVKLITMQ